MKRIVVIFVVLALLSTLLIGCSARSQARLSGTVNLGPLPSDMQYIDGAPQIITVSTESSGDVVMSYVSNNGHVYAQLYGCAYISVGCTVLHKQGRYEWNMPNSP